jgi:hypothetical protein
MPASDQCIGRHSELDEAENFRVFEYQEASESARTSYSPLLTSASTRLTVQVPYFDAIATICYSPCFARAGTQFAPSQRRRYNSAVKILAGGVSDDVLWSNGGHCCP